MESISQAQLQTAIANQQRLFNGKSPELLLDIFKHLANKQ
jgi:hypothetical protein